MTRFFAVFCLITFLLLSEALHAERPNIVVFLTDDQGWGDLSVSGNTDLETPHIDSLARDGASFDRFFVCPVCSPTRAEFLTGRHHPRGGVYSTSAGGERLNLEEVTLADVFRDAGYATGAFGKWHNGMQFPYHPNGRGFDEFYGFCSGHWGDYFSPPLEHNGKLVQGEGFCVDDFTTKAIDFIKANQDKPFLAYLPYNTPHSPMQVPDEFWDRFKDKEFALAHRDPKKEEDLHKRCSLAMCENIDWNVGRILAALKELELEENTIVLFFHDNGPNGWRWNGGMRGKKGSTDEGGVRSPLLVRWPERIEAGLRIPQISSVLDLLPTLVKLADLPYQSPQPLDGRSLAPLLLQEEGDWPDRILISHWKNRTGARNQRFRLDEKGRLYDLTEDPGQDRDVSGQHPQVKTELTAAVTQYKQEVASLIGEDNRPFVIAHPGMIYTQIPARDGTAHGNIERSNKFPNCSYFRNWTSVNDAITWEAEVAAAGTYRVELAYACPTGDAGTRFRLSFKDSALEFQLTEAHDVPERGGENDRFARVESYVKDFRTIPVGEIQLKKGPGTLRLEATEIPGATAMEFRLLLLTRI